MSRFISKISGVMGRALLGGGPGAQRGILSSPAVDTLSAVRGGAAASLTRASGCAAFVHTSSFAPKGASDVKARTWRAPDRMEDGQPNRGPQHDLVKKYLSEDIMSNMDLNRIALKEARAQYARHDLDVGSTEVQVAVLTTKIQYMIKHLLTHRKDHSSRRGLQGMLDTRRKLLKYLRRTDGDRYGDLIFRLGLRDNVVGMKGYDKK